MLIIIAENRGARWRTIYQFTFQFTKDKKKKKKVAYGMINVSANNIKVGELFRQYQLPKTLAVIVLSLQGH